MKQNKNIDKQWSIDQGDYKRPFEETRTYAVKQKRKKIVKKSLFVLGGFILTVIIYIALNYFLFDNKGLPFDF